MTKRWKRGSERIARKAKVTHSKPKKRSATSWELYKKKTGLNHRRLGVFSLAHTVAFVVCLHNKRVVPQDAPLPLPLPLTSAAALCPQWLPLLRLN